MENKICDIYKAEKPKRFTNHFHEAGGQTAFSPGEIHGHRCGNEYSPD
jgi:hypothetical protein